MNAGRSLVHPRDQILDTIERIYRFRMTTTSGGNLSIRDPSGDIWITPARIDKGSLRRDDIVLVRAGGAVQGHHPPSSELPFHREIYAQRPDVRGIVHQDGTVSALTLAGGGRLPVQNLVICAGAYSHLLARQLGEHVLLEAERGYHIVLSDPGVKISRSLTYARTPGAATPMDMGLRLAGTDEFAGLDAEPNYARADALFNGVARNRF